MRSIPRDGGGGAKSYVQVLVRPRVATGLAHSAMTQKSEAVGRGDPGSKGTLLPETRSLEAPAGLGTLGPKTPSATEVTSVPPVLGAPLLPAPWSHALSPGPEETCENRVSSPYLGVQTRP